MHALVCRGCFAPPGGSAGCGSRERATGPDNAEGSARCVRVGRQIHLSLEILPPPAVGGRCASRSLDGQAFVALTSLIPPMLLLISFQDILHAISLHPRSAPPSHVHLLRKSLLLELLQAGYAGMMRMPWEVCHCMWYARMGCYEPPRFFPPTLPPPPVPSPDPPGMWPLGLHWRRLPCTYGWQSRFAMCAVPHPCIKGCDSGLDR